MALLVGLLVVFARSVRERKRFAAIVDVDAEVARIRAAAERDASQLKAAAASDAVRLAQDSARQELHAKTLVASAQAEADRLRAAAAHDAESLRRAIESQRSERDKVERETTSVRAQLGQLGDELRKVEGSLEDISHDVGGASNTVDVTYFSASTWLSSGMPACRVYLSQ